MAGTKKTMKALVARGIGDYKVENVVPEYKIEELPMPTAGEGEMVVKVEACGICIGDVKISHLQDAWGGKERCRTLNGRSLRDMSLSGMSSKSTRREG